MRRLLILVAALALLTTACKMEVNAEFIINADQSGEVVFEIGFDDEVAAIAEANGASPDEMLGDLDFEDIPGAVATTERRGDMTFTIINVPIDDFTEAEGLGGDVVAGLADGFEITFTDDRVPVSGAVDLGDALGDSDDLGGLPPEMIAEFFSVSIGATLPGKILEHNADSQDGNTLTWNIDLTSASFEIFAESDPNAAGGSSSLLLYLLIGAGVVLAVLVLWMFMRKREGSGAVAATPPPPVEDTPPPAPPPAE